MSITFDDTNRAGSSSFVEQASRAAMVPARIMLSSIFLISGAQKLTAYEATAGYMNAFGVPGALLPAVIVFEIAAALALIVGYKARVAAFLLAGFSILAGAIFHFDPADQIQTIMLLKNVAIAGGLLAIVAAGPGALSLDRRG
ncbi:MAG: DoxX family protein [Pseudomonadota bacterium]